MTLCVCVCVCVYEISTAWKAVFLNILVRHQKVNEILYL